MIEETYVSFETAKLLKDIGVFLNINTYYNKEGVTFTSVLQCPRPNELMERPTQAMLMRWLRETQNLFIEITFGPRDGYKTPKYNVRFKTISAYNSEVFLYPMKDVFGDTYEQACEAAIKYCLENLI